jgi:hypothetical protein
MLGVAKPTKARKARTERAGTIASRGRCPQQTRRRSRIRTGARCQRVVSRREDTAELLKILEGGNTYPVSVFSREDRRERRVDERSERADNPSLEIRALEPANLRGACAHDIQPEARFYGAASSMKEAES